MRENRKNIAAGAAFVALIVGFLILISAITTTSDSQETQLVYDAVKNAALTCYAAEGSYPENLQYLRDHYKLAYNQEKFVVEYDAFASNLMPTINVLERGNIDV
ncbi:MAG: hypothetical protein IKE08_06475 [Clostridia bacterium]|nr:hypothetical protein [Clostridia bacterium]MBR0388086.1 hypothetical protein [Clostridia bacterium]MBR2602323.1 hypothetical protein [Clostridia bacterium]MBR2664799.1 hypothetical protein [Clostridia bacterium]MBR7175666.1 hypothetical protein [Clostridia bacterium]